MVKSITFELLNNLSVCCDRYLNPANLQSMKYEKNYNLFLETKRKIFYIFSSFLIVISIFFVISNLSKNLKDYDKNVEVYKKSRINVTETQKGFATVKNSELIITMENGREWTFSDEFDNYWEEIGNSSNSGKTYVIYTKGLTDSNPSQVEIENKIIYNLGTQDNAKYLILILTFICVIFSVFDYRKHRKKKMQV